MNATAMGLTARQSWILAHIIGQTSRVTFKRVGGNWIIGGEKR